MEIHIFFFDFSSMYLFPGELGDFFDFGKPSEKRWSWKYKRCLPFVRDCVSSKLNSLYAGLRVLRFLRHCYTPVIIPFRIDWSHEAFIAWSVPETSSSQEQKSLEPLPLTIGSGFILFDSPLCQVLPVVGLSGGIPRAAELTPDQSLPHTCCPPQARLSTAS